MQSTALLQMTEHTHTNQTHNVYNKIYTATPKTNQNTSTN